MYPHSQKYDLAAYGRRLPKVSITNLVGYLRKLKQNGYTAMTSNWGHHHDENVTLKLGSKKLRVHVGEAVSEEVGCGIYRLHN